MVDSLELQRAAINSIAESNGDVRILMASYEIAVCAHVQYKIGQKQRRTAGATSGGLKLQCIHNCHIF